MSRKTRPGIWISQKIEQLHNYVTSWHKYSSSQGAIAEHWLAPTEGFARV